MGQESDNTYRCSHCAAELKPGQMVCDYCGQEREGYERQTYTSDNYTYAGSGCEGTKAGREAEFGAEYSNRDDKIGALLPYVGKKREYYAKKFREMKDTNKKNTWNWCAFFFGPFWLVYRKVYVPAFVVAVVSAFMESFLLQWTLFILVGIFGNYIYMTHIEKLVMKEKSFASGLDREKFINKNAGTSIVGIFVLLLVMLLI